MSVNLFIINFFFDNTDFIHEIRKSYKNMNKANKWYILQEIFHYYNVDHKPLVATGMV